MLSPLGPAEQLQGGSRLISASSFCIRLALALSLDILEAIAGAAQRGGRAARESARGAGGRGSRGAQRQERLTESTAGG